MTEEEKKAIRYLEAMNKSLDFNKQGFVYGSESIETTLNLIQKQQEEIDYLRIIYEWDKRKYKRKYLEERRKEQPGLRYPDSDEIYKKYYEQRSEIEKKDKIIDLMLQEFTNCEFDLKCSNCNIECERDYDQLYICNKQYFEKQVEKE